MPLAYTFPLLFIIALVEVSADLMNMAVVTVEMQSSQVITITQSVGTVKFDRATLQCMQNICLHCYKSNAVTYTVCCGLKGHKIVHWVQGQVNTMFTLFPPAYCPGVSPSPFQQLHLLYPIHIILLFSLQDDLILCVNSCTNARIHTIRATEKCLLFCFAMYYFAVLLYVLKKVAQLGPHHLIIQQCKCMNFQLISSFN